MKCQCDNLWTNIIGISMLVNSQELHIHSLNF